jgi:hypothetical protein
MPTGSKPRKWFEKWRDPREFYRTADDGLKTSFCTETIPEHYLREAWVVGGFGWIWRDDRGPCEVHLLAEGSFPDAQLKAEGVNLKLEVTMALPRGYKPFDEWKELRTTTKPKETSGQSPGDVREAIRTAVQKKARKHYAEPPSLLASVGNLGALSPEEMRQVTEPWIDRFDAIYLWCGMDAVVVWPTLCVLRGKEPFWRPPEGSGWEWSDSS